MFFFLLLLLLQSTLNSFCFVATALIMFLYEEQNLTRESQRQRRFDLNKNKSVFFFMVEKQKHVISEAGK